MIYEAYVSYEVAKLLKEKGFEGRCSAYYTNTGLLCCGNTYTHCDMMLKTDFDICMAPTQQMAMR